MPVINAQTCDVRYYTEPAGSVVAAGISSKHHGTYREYQTEPPSFLSHDQDPTLTQRRSELRLNAHQVGILGGARFKTEAELADKLRALVDHHQTLMAKVDRAYGAVLPRRLLAPVARAEFEPFGFADTIASMFEQCSVVPRRLLVDLMGVRKVKALEADGRLAQAGRGRSKLGPRIREKANTLRVRFGSRAATFARRPAISPGCIIDGAVEPWMLKTGWVHRNRRLFGPGAQRS